MSGANQPIDRIERDTLVEAPIDRVFQLVSEAGWWIGDGDRSGQRMSHHGDVVVVDDPRYGRFPVLLIASDAPRYVSFRSTDDPAQRPDESNSTLVEFFLTETADGTLLRVVESGFAALGLPAEEHIAVIEDNTKGWETQLGFARRDAARPAA